MAHRLIQNAVKSLLALTIAFAVTSTSVSQAQAQTVAGGESKARGGPRKQLATIIFAGLGGSVLGLSTLSFYGRPQDHLANIAIGFAVGIIGGTAFVTYKAATNPAEFYGDVNATEALQIAELSGARTLAPAPTLSWAFEF